jgi:alpha-glucosidase
MPVNWQDTVFSDPSENFVSNPRPQSGEEVDFRIRIYKDADVSSMFMMVWPIGEGIYYKMEKERDDEFFSWYKVTYRITVPRLDYRFYMVVKGREWYYSALGLTAFEPPDSGAFTIYSGDDLSNWTPDSIFYQIFPDRFCREGDTPLGDLEVPISVPEGELTFKRFLSEWDEPGIKTTRENLSFQFYGGTFKGIKKQISYLLDLGINAIYLNPVYPAISAHRYDAADFTTVDQLLGSEQDLAECIEALHDAGIKILFDGVLNHTGIMHRWFDINGKENPPGAYASKESPWYNYYYFYNHPHEYAYWMEAVNLPKLKLENPEVRRDLIGNDDSAIKKWLHEPFGLDGWRLDTANLYGKFPQKQFDREFSRELHDAIKSVNPDAFILGETFYDPAGLIGHDMYESAMNYRGFMLPIKKWLIGESYFRQVPKATEPIHIDFPVESVMQQMQAVRREIPFQNQLRMFNLLDSHDTSRFYTDIGTDFNRLKIGLALQFTYIGIPSIYYGDEIGMEGAGDPDCRRPMRWNRKDQDVQIYNLYQRLIQLRKEVRALSHGSFIDLYAKDNVLGWARISPSETVITICNASEQPRPVQISLAVLGLKSGSALSYLDDTVLHWNDYELNYTLQPLQSIICRVEQA